LFLWTLTIKIPLIELMVKPFLIWKFLVDLLSRAFKDTTRYKYDTAVSSACESRPLCEQVQGHTRPSGRSLQSSFTQGPE